MPESKLLEELKTKLKKPKMYKIIMYNDDYTPMQYVVELLIDVFNKSSQEAYELMMKIHTGESSVVGVYTYDVAVTKKNLADQRSKTRKFPLKITINEE